MITEAFLCHSRHHRVVVDHDAILQLIEHFTGTVYISTFDVHFLKIDRSVCWNQQKSLLVLPWGDSAVGCSRWRKNCELIDVRSVHCPRLWCLCTLQSCWHRWCNPVDSGTFSVRFRIISMLCVLHHACDRIWAFYSIRWCSPWADVPVRHCFRFRSELSYSAARAFAAIDNGTEFFGSPSR